MNATAIILARCTGIGSCVGGVGGRGDDGSGSGSRSASAAHVASIEVDIRSIIMVG